MKQNISIALVYKPQKGDSWILVQDVDRTTKQDVKIVPDQSEFYYIKYLGSIIKVECSKTLSD